MISCLTGGMGGYKGLVQVFLDSRENSNIILLAGINTRMYYNLASNATILKHLQTPDPSFYPLPSLGSGFIITMSGSISTLGVE